MVIVKNLSKLEEVEPNFGMFVHYGFKLGKSRLNPSLLKKRNNESRMFCVTKTQISIHLLERLNIAEKVNYKI